MKKILTDVDGVLLWWEPAFHKWMEVRAQHPLECQETYHIHVMYPTLSQDEARYIMREFGNSSWMGFLEPLRDAQDGVYELQKLGYKFDVITSLSKDPYTARLRTMNLNDQFGETAFSNYIYLDTGADKLDTLKQYQDTGYYWIEDKPQNCDAGLECGLQPIIIDHPYNRWYDNDRVFRVTTWAEIVDIVKNEKTCK